MAGLDTRGLADGFLSGFQVMGQYQHQQRQNERADKRMEMEEQRFGLQMETAEMQKEQLQQASDMESLKFTLGKIAGGMEIDESEVDLLRKYPRFQSALDPNTDFSIQKAMSVIDPEMPDDLNDPEALAALNQMFGPDINRGGGGQKRIIGAVPAPDGQGLNFELEIIGKDGKTYNAPMTQNRGTADEGDEWVKSVDVGKAIDQVQGMRMLRLAFQTPEAQENASRVLGLLRGDSQERWEQVEGPGGSLLQRNAVTGEMKSVVGRAPARSGAGSSREYAPSSDVKTIEYFKDQGYDHEEAVRLTMELKGRGEDDYGRGQDQLDYYQGRVSELESIKSGREWQGMAEEARSAVNAELEQIRSQRDQVADRIYIDDQPPQQGGKRQGGAPSAAVDYLRNNDSPQIREQFRAKYGYLPEGL